MAAILVAGCSDTVTEPEQGTDPQPTVEYPVDGFVTVAPGVTLHYLDFGGEGDPILLLPGLGNTANIFRDLAPPLSAHHRVLALTRRGFGRSSQPSNGYDPATLASDVATVLDSLGIERVNLVGHSIAGEELSRFAVDYPERLGRLVYLDAAYDRTTSADSSAGAVPTPAWATPPEPSPSDLASLVALQAFLAGIAGVQFPLEEVAATTVVANDGAVVGFVTPAWIGEAIRSAVEEPDYSAIAAPALAIYALPNPDDVAPWLSPGSADWASAQAWIDSVLTPEIRVQAARFDSLTAGGTVVEREGAHHYVFIDQRSWVATEVLSFLAGG